MAQGRSYKIIKMIKWIRTSRLTIQNSLSTLAYRFDCAQDCICRTVLWGWLRVPARGSTAAPKGHTAIGREEGIIQLDGQPLMVKPIGFYRDDNPPRGVRGAPPVAAGREFGVTGVTRN